LLGAAQAQAVVQRLFDEPVAKSTAGFGWVYICLQCAQRLQLAAVLMSCIAQINLFSFDVSWEPALM
jgi:hypothetical protein